MISVVGNVTRLLAEFTAIALSDPLSAILLAVGSAMVAVTVGVFGYLVLGAVVDTVTPDVGREPPRQAR